MTKIDKSKGLVAKKINTSMEVHGC